MGYAHGMKAKEFLKSYRAAFDAFDPEAIADHYHYPSLMASMDRSDAFVTRDDAVRVFRRILDNHRRIGYHTATVLDTSRVTLTDNLAFVTVRWRFETAAGQAISEFDCSYTLADHGQGIHIISAIVHG